jgi:hypothetical protein
MAGGANAYFMMSVIAAMAWPLMASAPMRLIATPAGGVMFRLAAALAWAIALHRALGDHAVDGWAATALIPAVMAALFHRKIPAEAVAFQTLAVVWLFAILAESPWGRLQDAAGWRGGLVVVAMIALVCTWRERAAMIHDAQTRMRVLGMLAGLACLLATLWSTQMVVWRIGWPGTVTLWSALGFLSVATGLWQRLRALRAAGLVLFSLAMVKLFVHDVWDFTAFTRVVSFIVLGVALILLGLFYSHFANTLRKWL